VAVVLLGAVLSFGPLVRGVARAKAEHLRLALTIGSVRPAWGGVVLGNVTVAPVGAPGVQVRLGAVRVLVTPLMSLRSLEVDGMKVELTGSIEALRDQLVAWRGTPDKGHGARSSGADLTVRDLSVLWTGAGAGRGSGTAELHGGRVSVSGGEVSASASALRAEVGPARLELLDAIGNLSASGQLVRGRARSLEIDGTSRPKAPEVVAETAPRGAFLPDLHAIREAVRRASAFLTEHISDDADIGIDAVTWNISRSEGRAPLTLGPGALAVARSSAGVDVAFTSDPTASSTPLSLHLVLPGDPGASTLLTLGGGPVTLSMLGVQEGAAGLVDVGSTTLAGRARVAISGAGDALTFDVDASARGVSIADRRIATEVVRDLDLQVRARGAFEGPSQLRLDEVAAAVGAARISASGAIEQTPEHLAAVLRIEVPATPCQALLTSIPTALLPALNGAEMTGTFGARGRLVFDSRSLDDLALDYDVQDECRMTRVPPDLARDRFSRPFTYRVYLPDGSVDDATTGPGTPAWTPLDQISPYMTVAVLTTEDGAFPRHHGFNRASIRSSLIANLKARRFVRGASTITMQLAKNLFLSREKTLSRKLEEVVLTDYLEQVFDKEELLELYLNVIEFGPGVYGITDAAEYYFGRTPAELNLAECMFLSSVLPSPLRYGALRDKGELPPRRLDVLRTLIRLAAKNGRITDAERAEGETETIAFWHGGPRPAPRPPVRARPLTGGATDDASTLPVQVPEEPVDQPPP
jgi:hypothetical protein